MSNATRRRRERGYHLPPERRIVVLYEGQPHFRLRFNRPNNRPLSASAALYQAAVDRVEARDHVSAMVQSDGEWGGTLVLPPLTWRGPGRGWSQDQTDTVVKHALLYEDFRSHFLRARSTSPSVVRVQRAVIEACREEGLTP
jgi:hypothetical protein